METHPQSDSNAALRQAVYGILIFVGIGGAIGRILAVDSVDQRSAADGKFGKVLAAKRTQLKSDGLSPIDVDYALLQEKTRLAVKSGVWRPFQSENDRSRWCTVRALVEPDMQVPGAPFAIDKVLQQPGWDTIDKVQHNGHFYSSKPPLLEALMAGEYWVIYQLTDNTLRTNPYEIGRFILITINGACLLLTFVFTGRLIERLGMTDWGRILVMASCVFGTFLTTFAITINNHLPAAACTAVLVDALVRIWFDGDRRMWTFAVTGFFSAMLAANELPAAALSAAATAVVAWLAPRRMLLAYAPPALLVTVAFFGTNWIAVNSLKPAYMHRSEGDNWYDYPNSYWNHRTGIDVGEKSAAVYSFNVLIGHHGIFSLTPIWWLSLLGGALWMIRGDRCLKSISLLILGVTLVCMVFYIWWPTVDRNYGGVACAFRWVFWMAPMWFVLMLPAADLLSHRRWWRGVGLALLALSALSANYPTWNPWTSPWIMNFMGYMGWL